MSIERDLSDYYDSEADAGARLAMGSRGRRDELRTAFIEQLREEGRGTIVEPGAGPGTDAVAFIEAGFAYTGFDLAVGNARAALADRLPIIPGSLYHPPFRSQSFGAAWTMSTLLHVPDDRFDHAMDAIALLVEPGSPIAIGLWGGTDREFVNETDHFDPPRFFSLRSNERIQVMLGEHGAIETFESWPSDRGDWIYQFITVRR